MWARRPSLWCGWSVVEAWSGVDSGVVLRVEAGRDSDWELDKAGLPWEAAPVRDEER